MTESGIQTESDNKVVEMKKEGSTATFCQRQGPPMPVHCIKWARPERVRSEQALPSRTLHYSLWEHVSFLSYESDSCLPPPMGEISPHPLIKMHSPYDIRIFIGQMPYRMTSTCLQWICAQICGWGGGAISIPDRIMKQGVLPQGCFHAYCSLLVYEKLHKVLHKRALADATGIWIATNDEEFVALQEYCDFLRSNRKNHRVSKHFPYHLIVIEMATSTYLASTR